MTLDGMNKYLEDKGFEVWRERDSKRDLYIFTIRKNGVTMSSEFKWPKTPNSSYRDQLIRAFLDKLVLDFIGFPTGSVDDVKEEKNTMTTIWDGHIIFETRGDAEGVLEELRTLIKEYGSAAVADFEDLVGLGAGSDHTDFGWISIDSTKVCRVRDGYTLFLPRPIPFGQKRVKPHVSYRKYYGVDTYSKTVPSIKNVIHNDPATIVFWEDGSKTVVKCQPGDIYDPEKGLAMAISKKTLGNQGNYCNVFKKWVPEQKRSVKAAPKWRVWWSRYDKDGKLVGASVSLHDYVYKSSATRWAKKNLHQLPDDDRIEWIVSQTNPWKEGE